MFYRQPENNLQLFPLPNKILDILYFPCSNWLLVSSSFRPTLKKTCLAQQTTAADSFLLTDTQSKSLNRALFICLFKIVTFQMSPCSQNVCVGHCAQMGICLPNIPAAAPAGTSFASHAVRNTTWDYGPPL